MCNSNCIQLMINKNINVDNFSYFNIFINSIWKIKKYFNINNT